MTVDQGFELHPGAASDITNIWEFIARDNLRAAGRFREDILNTTRKLAGFPIKAINGRISLHGHFVFRLYAITLSFMRQTKSRFS
jgi:plasmid stabilization system protein ParE